MHLGWLTKAILALFVSAPAMAAQPECVVLLHGLARTSNSMDKIQTAFEHRGYVVKNLGYPSRRQPIEALSPEAVGRGIDACRASHTSQIHFVTHSLGGILVRYYLSKNTVPDLGKVVMLAPPNRGSEVVDDFSSLPGFAYINGPAGNQLGTSSSSIPNTLGPVTYPVGVIAGTVTVNPILSGSFDEPNDGKVSLSSARVEGMTDFIVLPTSHPFITKNDRAIQQALHFIANGQFARHVP